MGEPAMPRIEEHIHIDRPVAEVFAYGTDPDTQTLINTNMEAYELDGPMEKGARPRGVSRVAGKKLEWVSEVTEFDEGARVEIRSVEAPMDFHITWLYEADGDGTMVRFIQEADGLGGFFGRLSDPIVTKMYSRDVRSNLEKLKLLVEEAGGVSA
jgi:uncharacterized membrane protein